VPAVKQTHRPPLNYSILHKSHFTLFIPSNTSGSKYKRNVHNATYSSLGLQQSGLAAVWAYSSLGLQQSGLTAVWAYSSLGLQQSGLAAVWACSSLGLQQSGLAAVWAYSSLGGCSKARSALTTAPCREQEKT